MDGPHDHRQHRETGKDSRCSHERPAPPPRDHHLPPPGVDDRLYPTRDIVRHGGARTG